MRFCDSTPHARYSAFPLEKTPGPRVAAFRVLAFFVFDIRTGCANYSKMQLFIHVDNCVHNWIFADDATSSPDRRARLLSVDRRASALFGRPPGNTGPGYFSFASPLRICGLSTKIRFRDINIPDVLLTAP